MADVGGQIGFVVQEVSPCAPTQAQLEQAEYIVQCERRMGSRRRFNTELLACALSVHETGASLEKHGVAAAWLALGNQTATCSKSQLISAVAFVESVKRMGLSPEIGPSTAGAMQAPHHLRAAAVTEWLSWTLNDLRSLSTALCDCTHPFVWRGAGRAPTGWRSVSKAATCVRLAIGGAVDRTCTSANSRRTRRKVAYRANVQSVPHANLAPEGKEYELRKSKVEAYERNEVPYGKLVVHKMESARAVLASASAGRYGGTWCLPPGQVRILEPYVPRDLSSEPAAEVWLSHHPSRCVVHCDEPNSVLMVVHGSKTIVLAPPSFSQELADDLEGARKHRLKNNSLKAPLGCERDKRHFAWRETMLGEGDAVYIPALWWHQIDSTAGTIAISTAVRITI